ncbi:MAG TPA: methionine--tRNA ligase [Candidatus Stercoripulliclostridium merdipullorum]|uniref:Methionine--tRNA ligase n=1 Tax=Candidatus Stercoripulliclostridium merdipullorum TaxID=2840952 RepID=A0A9D1NB03_9FIRM|nr:methionine--tRNA ligase [Candidatus Stercoripulliclostridium merdipullorum]
MSDQAKKYYITTPIYYPSGKWHLGTCYTTVVCDALARFKRKEGYDVFYLTGTDEHGQKIEKTAESKGMQPKEFLDKQVGALIDLWKLLGISYDKFIRTTDEYHKKAVAKIFQKLYDQGDIYKSSYEGWYCTPCESFWTKSQLVDGKCPDCGREVELTKEESYFFRLSKYQDRLIDLIENHPDFLLPKSRQNEMLNNFLRPGLQDLCVSRSSFRWGIPVPFDPQHVVYVWIDALTNYITALGYGSEDDSLFRKYWPADLHMMGKEIVRFHSIIWPALLMALDIPLPKEVYGHGWLLLGSEKISKSKGNIVDPFELSARYSVDAVRYFLLREVPFGSDGMYTNRAFLTRINTDLCNSLGNLLSRTTAMVNQYFGGVLPAPDVKEAVDDELTSMIDGLFDRVRDNMDKLLVPEALHEIWTVIGRANKYIDETTPWILAKDPAKQGRLATVLYNLSEALRVSAVLLSAFLIETPAKILSCFGLEAPARFGDGVRYGKLKGGETVLKAGKLYERIDIEKELIAMEKRAEELAAESAKKEEQVPETPKKATIQYDDFAKLDLKVGKIVAAEPVKRSEKLLKFTVEIGAERRTIVSGIAKYYKPEETIGKLVSVVTNLAPVKLCGVVSEGMLMCASDADGKVVLLAPEAEVASGSEIS